MKRSIPTRVSLAVAVAVAIGAGVAAPRMILVRGRTHLFAFGGPGRVD